MLPLTEKEKKVYEFIKEFIQANGYSPSTREIASFFNIAPKNAHKHLKNLEEKGYIRRTKNISRGISLILKKIPLVTTAYAGNPSEINEIADEFYEIDASLFPYKDIFLVRVSGDSMINAHIEDGDIAVVARDVEILSGDIVVVSIFNELTLKRFIENKGKIILHPENENYKDIVLNGINRDEVKVIGKVVGIIRRIK